jgi:hypothetical protein
MSFLAFIQSALNPISNLISEAIPDADKRLELEIGIREALMAQESTFVQASRDVVVAEAQGESWLQRTWRPILMLTFGAIIANNYILIPWLMAFGVSTVAVLEMPVGLWALLTTGLGGYIAARTVEKVNGAE